MFGKSEDRADYQETPGPMAAMARDLPDGHVIPAHEHRRAQLIYGTSGAIVVTTPDGSWVVPRHRAVWVPRGVRHAMRTCGAVTLRTLYIDQDARIGLPVRCTVIAVSALLKELIEAATRVPVHYDPFGRDGKVMSLLLDELRPSAVPALHLPMPDDPDLAQICEEIVKAPHENRTLDEWAARCYLSRRTLARRFRDATGYSLGKWRQQALLLAAVQMLAEGRSVSTIAAELGYDSPSAFTAMFTRALGVPPSRYFQN
ncbi:AraC family transcriptional regulator [Amycolatopsis rhizosphaerae]|uniref:HTH-type transcriptional regulator RipA n=1 Tax=Amycolatopsis rhizosphaerae TaxID=2053003 RepID=A0A558DNM5_9PSEU|nr:helix-turn-helix transcriptional regulator [Amycolatopsis rhizosphaerae]TVT62624.1 AraC family transcriptional regulator [Amycolatopsis rhizosphaerae]